MENADEVQARVGRRVGELRVAAGLTQAEVAEALGTTLSNYQRIEHGTQNLTIKTMVAVANAIGTPVAKLFEAISSRRGGRGRPKGR